MERGGYTDAELRALELAAVNGDRDSVDVLVSLCQPMVRALARHFRGRK